MHSIAWTALQGMSHTGNVQHHMLLQKYPLSCCILREASRRIEKLGGHAFWTYGSLMHSKPPVHECPQPIPAGL